MSFYKVIRSTCKGLYKVWFNPQIYNSELIPLDGPVIIVSNHIHKLDPANSVISTKRVIHFLAKDKYCDKPIIGNFFKWMGCIKVLSNQKNDDAKKYAIEALNNNEVIGIFPEGTRNKTNDLLLPFKYGAVSMTKKTNAWIVPCAVKGKYKFRSKDLIIKYGKPFKIKRDENLENANKKLFDEIKKLLINNSNGGKE